jgi:2-C-methyl-D-erythritol 4-phosphate cytidylyltransferase
MNTAIIVAGGQGKRLGLGYNKVFAKLCKYPLLAYTLANFELASLVDKVIVVAGDCSAGTADKDRGLVLDLLNTFSFKKVSDVVAGGAYRMDSVAEGLKAAGLSDDDFALIHDGCRPFADAELIDTVIREAKGSLAAVCGLTPKDSICSVSSSNELVTSFNRDSLVALHTPLAARWSELKAARKKAQEEEYLNTPGFEDSIILSKYGQKVKVVQSSPANVKVTTKEDLLLAERMLESEKFSGMLKVLKDDFSNRDR